MSMYLKYQKMSGPCPNVAPHTTATQTKILLTVATSPTELLVLKVAVCALLTPLPKQTLA